jgi:hypothetical protein
MWKLDEHTKAKHELLCAQIALSNGYHAASFAVTYNIANRRVPDVYTRQRTKRCSGTT